MHNVGSVFRSADSLGVEAIWLWGISPRPPHRDIHKTALGAEESVPWKYFQTREELIAQLKADRWTIIAIEQSPDSIQLSDFPWKDHQKIALVLGHEVKGVSSAFTEAAEFILEIPQHGTKNSLNVSVAAGISFWEWQKSTGNK
jgi:tRNA G18 (ribose-2'-O)-methylase SpoU